MEVFLASIATEEYVSMASALTEMGATNKDVDVMAFAKDLEKIFSSIQDLDIELIVATARDTTTNATAVSANIVVDERQMNALFLDVVLRYVGVVDAVSEEGRVELQRYKKDHPFAQLSGSDNIIAFTTTRYKEQPLIVRGPGAGAQVTAGGIFSDILRLASYLGAPS